MRAVSEFLSAYPASFETVLRTEEAVEAHLQTCRALKRSSILPTVGAQAFSRGDFGCHICGMSVVSAACCILCGCRDELQEILAESRIKSPRHRQKNRG